MIFSSPTSANTGFSCDSANTPLVKITDREIKIEVNKIISVIILVCLILNVASFYFQNLYIIINDAFKGQHV